MTVPTGGQHPVHGEQGPAFSVVGCDAAVLNAQAL